MMMANLHYWAQVIYKKMFPSALKIALVRFIDFNRYKLRLDIIKYLRNELSVNPDNEKAKVLKILRKNPVCMFPYAYNYVPHIHKIAVYADSDGDKYVLHEGKKLFFPNDMGDRAIKFTYAWLLLEQSPFSPHRYETDSFRVREGDIIADCGAAEGIWALSSVEKAKKIYLFECEDKWIAALQKTFAPWKEKVEIVNKFVSDKTSGNCVTLDDVLGGGGGKFY